MLTLNEIYKKYTTEKSCISNNMARKKINQYDCLSMDSEQVNVGKGRNRIPPPEKDSLLKQYLEKFKDPIIIVLLVVFVLSMSVAAYEVFYLGRSNSLLLEPLGVLTALLLATGVAFFFELKANKEFEILNKVKDSRPVKVYRKDSTGRVRLIEIKKHDVAIGDYVKLESGDEVPADGELIESESLMVDESNFTGELYANKTTDEEHFDADATYKSNEVLRGSTVIEGNGVFVVKRIGMDSEEGKGVARTQEGSDVETPLNKQLAQLGRWISIASFVFAALIVLGRMIYFFVVEGHQLQGQEGLIETMEFILGSVMIAVTLIVVAVPEGLPMSVTVSLALSMSRMLRENNLVRKLHACETMGAATVICTDKTGTLTKNSMTVMETDIYGGDEELELVRQNMAVNSTAEVFKDEEGKLVTIGNPTEVSLLKWMHKNGPDYEEYRNEANVQRQVPFSTETKYMLTTVVMHEGEKPITFIKGAPEIVLGMCDKVAGNQSHEHIMRTLESYQGRAMRTLGFAYRREDEGEDNSLVFLGVVGIADPIRDDVAEAIDTCKNKAGVRVIIVTGDTPGTANEIGRQIGLLEPNEEKQTITGPEFAAMSDEDALALVSNPNFKIISRARPDDKARLVTLLQQVDQVVAVTGDGTNDAPALSKAQVGLSMGDGTSRAKEASDITIIDNSFTSINKAIMWGRSLYQNIRRFIIFQMTINVCACLIVLLGAFVGLDSPLTVTQMLWVNLIMDTFAAMALSSLPADKRVLLDKPRNPNSHILDRKMVKQILSVGIIFFVLLVGFWQLLWHKNIEFVSDYFNMESLKLFFTGFFDLSKGKAHMSSYELGVFFTTFVMLQFWNLFNAKYFRTNRSLIRDLIDLMKDREKVKESYSQGFVWIALVIVLGQYLIVTYAGALFNVSPLHGYDWMWILLITSPVLVIPDVIRFISNRNTKQ